MLAHLPLAALGKSVVGLIARVLVEITVGAQIGSGFDQVLGGRFGKRFRQPRPGFAQGSAGRLDLAAPQVAFVPFPDAAMVGDGAKRKIALQVIAHAQVAVPVNVSVTPA